MHNLIATIDVEAFDESYPHSDMQISERSERKLVVENVTPHSDEENDTNRRDSTQNFV